RLSRTRVVVVCVRVSGPRVCRADVRRLNLDLVLEKLGRAVMFASDGQPVEPSRGLYKRPAFVLRECLTRARGEDLDMLAAATEQLQEAPDREVAVSLAEISTADRRAPDDVCADLLGRLDTVAAASVPTLVPHTA